MGLTLTHELLPYHLIAALIQLALYHYRFNGYYRVTVSQLIMQITNLNFFLTRSQDRGICNSKNQSKILHTRPIIVNLQKYGRTNTLKLLI